MRDLLTVLGIDKVTVVGHSFGGGVAMQFAYQFPERTERLVLVAPGGLGPEVTPAIRAITLPGFHQVMGLVTLPGVRHAHHARPARRWPPPASRTRATSTRSPTIYDSFKDPQARRPRSATWSRAVVDWRGQIVTMVDRAYLTQAMPMCVMWGTEDRGDPGASTPATPRRSRRGAHVEVIANAGHFPHKDHPQRFVKIVRRLHPLPPSRRRTTAAAGARCCGTGRGSRCRPPSDPGDAGRDRLTALTTRTPAARRHRGESCRQRSDGSGVAALLLDVRGPRSGRRCGTCERLLRPPRA